MSAKRLLTNFSPGPAALPTAVVNRFVAEFDNYRNSGYSIAECSHRSAMYTELHMETIAKIRRVLAIPKDYNILLLAGGATLQFAMVAYNFASGGVSDKASGGLSGKASGVLGKASDGVSDKASGGVSDKASGGLSGKASDSVLGDGSSGKAAGQEIRQSNGRRVLRLRRMGREGIAERPARRPRCPAAHCLRWRHARLYAATDVGSAGL